MKKLKLILAGLFVVGAANVFAQDSTRVTDDAAQQKTGPGVGAQGQPIGPTDDYRKDMTEIQSTEVPANLRSTLGDTQYKGWENNSKIYRSRNNDSFIVEMREGEQTKLHRFDQNGKPVKDF